MTRRGFTLEEIRDWPAYPGRPAGSEACIKPSFVLTHTLTSMSGHSLTVHQTYICTVFRRDDPIIDVLNRQHDWQPCPDKAGARYRIVPKKIGRLCAGMRDLPWQPHQPGSSRTPWEMYMRNGVVGLEHAVRIDVYWGTRVYDPLQKNRHAVMMKEALLLEKRSAPADGDDGTLGIRSWLYDEDRGCLLSSTREFQWLQSRVTAESFTVSDTVFGDAGIHAHRLPRDVNYWLLKNRHGYGPVHGIVERFGLYVLGKKGWRSEHAQIRKLWAPTPKLAALLRTRYPDVEVALLSDVVLDDGDD